MDQDEQQRISDRQQHLELSKSQSNVVKSWGQAVMVALICATLLMLIWSLWSWRGASNMAGATSAKIDAFVQHATEKLDKVDQIDGIAANIEAATAKLPGAVEQMSSDTHQAMASVRKRVDQLAPAINGVTATTQSLNSLVAHADTRIDGLLAALTAAATQFNLTVGTADRVIAEIAKQGMVTLDDVHAILGSPDWKIALEEIAKSAANIEMTTAKLPGIATGVDATVALVAEAMKRAPAIADSLQKIAKTSSAFQKAGFLANIFRLVAIGLGAL